MKKSLILLFVVVMLAALSLTACGGGTTPTATPAAPADSGTPAPSTPAPAAPAEKGTVTLLSWGGTVEETFIDENMAEKFYQDTGYKFELISKADSATIIATALAQKDSPEVDVVFCDMTAFMSGVQQGIFGQLSDYDLPNLAEVFDNMKFDTYCYNYVDYIGILYDQAAFDANGWAYPTGYEDLFRPELRGKISIDQFPSAYTDALIMPWADHDITKYQQAFDKLNKLAPYLYNISDTKSQVAEWFGNKNIVAAVYAYTTYLGFPVTYGLTDLGFTFPEEGVYLSPAGIGIMKNSKNPEGAAALMNWMISKEFQEFRNQRFGMQPVNRTAVVNAPGLTPEIQASARTLDVDALANSREEWLELWTEKVLNVPKAF